MKKLLFGALAAFSLLFALPAVAQQPQIPAAPIDSAVRIGKLDNGLTYYIRHNETPKGQADFFIAQKVGSILENDSQRGLAHFLEHMCFNGTKNFPGNQLIDWLEAQGVKFGQNLNAYTSIDETVYNISSVPVQRTGVIDSCLLILHDWADDLLLDPEEIEKERGVIHQEWRRSMQGQMRVLEQLLPKIYPNNRYAERLPIGTMEVVDNFAPQVLRDYYEAWYRPDQQGVIVVGDIDPDYIEAKIKEIFSPIKMPENAKVREYFAVEDTPGTIYAIGKDKEISVAVVDLMFKLKEQLLPRELRGSVASFGINYIRYMITNMLNQRLSDMAKKPDCPFAQARVSLGDFFVSSTKDAFDLEVVGKGNDVRPALQAAYREMLRAVRGGFTVSEYDRAKNEYISMLEKSYDQRNGRDNSSYAREYAAHFTKGDAIPGIKFELDMAKQISQAVPVSAINQMLPQLIGPDNRVLMALLPETDSFYVPTEAEFAAVISGVEAEEIEPFKEDVKAEPFIAQLPKAVEPRITDNAQWKAKELIYPNGAKVIVKSPKFKDNEITFGALAKGGLSAFNSDAATVKILPYAMGLAAGYGTYNSSDVEKYLSGKQTSLDLEASEYSREMSGTTTPKNVKTLMELIYQSFADFQIAEDDFAGMQARLSSSLANQEKTPNYRFGKGLYGILAKAPSRQPLTSADVTAASREEALAIISQLFSNPGDFTFVFVGDIDFETFVPLCNQYIGSLSAPRIAGVPYKVNPDFEYTTGATNVNEKMDMQTPQTWVAITANAKIPYSPKARVEASIAGQILSNRLLKKIREEMGAVYSIGASAQLDRLRDQNFILLIPFPMKPELKDQVLVEIKSMLNGMSEKVNDDEINPIKEFMLKEAASAKDKNDKWLGAILGTAMNGVDTFNGSAEVINSVTAADIQNLVKEVLNQNNYRVYVLDPENPVPTETNKK